MNFAIISSFALLLNEFQSCFTKPSFELFKALAIGWLTTPGRKTITNVVRTMGSTATRSHDAYQNFFSENKWTMKAISEKLFALLLVKLLPTGVIRLGGDDTLAKHFGRKIFGIGIFRDPVRSTDWHTSFTLAHNWVILYVLFKVPFVEFTWVAFPVCSRLRPKHEPENKKHQSKKRKKHTAAKIDKTMVVLMKEMIEQIVSLAPHRQFVFVTDAGYATLLGQLPKQTTIVSRIRKDAKLFDLPTTIPHKRGPHPKKGKLLPSPEQKTASATWEPVEVVIYGSRLTLSVCSYVALWYHVCKDQPIRIVIVRDPKGKYKDQFFFTQDLNMPLADVLEIIASRWSVETAHRELKQYLGMEQPQARLEQAVTRQAPFVMLLLSLIKLWYLTEGYLVDSFRDVKDPWYIHKNGLPLSDILRLLRCSYWADRIFTNSNLDQKQHEFLAQFIQFFSRASCLLVTLCSCFLLF
jgi:hypothetical protein